MFQSSFLLLSWALEIWPSYHRTSESFRSRAGSGRKMELSRVEKMSWRKLPWKIPVCRYGSWQRNWSPKVIRHPRQPSNSTWQSVSSPACTHTGVFQGSFHKDVFGTWLNAVFLPRPAQLGRDSPMRWQGAHICNAHERNRKLIWNICLLHSSLHHSYSSVTRCRTVLLRHHQRVRVAPAKHRPLALHRCQGLGHVTRVGPVTNRQFWIALVRSRWIFAGSVSARLYYSQINKGQIIPGHPVYKDTRQICTCVKSLCIVRWSSEYFS